MAFKGLTTLITGANRGIGLELARQLHHQGAHVIAVCRTPSVELKQLAPAHTFSGIAVDEDASVKKLASELRQKSLQLDLLVNNAGIMARDSVDDPNWDEMLRQFQVNSVGPLRVSHALLAAQRFRANAKIAMITSRMGSIADNTSGGRYGYRMSKAALNMASQSLAVDLKPRGIAVGIFHPGRVATDMLGPDAKVGVNDTVDTKTSAANLLKRFAELNLGTTGRFVHANGTILPW